MIFLLLKLIAIRRVNTRDANESNNPGVVPGLEGIRTQEFIGNTIAHILNKVSNGLESDNVISFSSSLTLYDTLCIVRVKNN